MDWSSQFLELAGEVLDLSICIEIALIQFARRFQPLSPTAICKISDGGACSRIGDGKRSGGGAERRSGGDETGVRTWFGDGDGERSARGGGDEKRSGGDAEKRSGGDETGWI